MKLATMKSNIDNLEISVTEMTPSKGIKVKGIVQILHGMMEDKKRYYSLMRFLNKNGYITIIHDHRGHGESVEKPSELGYFYNGGKKGLINDAHQLTLAIKKRHPNLPIYILAHSLGSLIASCYLKNNDDLINGVILCGMPNENKHVKGAIRFVKLMNILKGPYYRSYYIHNFIFEDANKQFIEEGENAWLCSDKKVVSLYNKNPNYGFVFTIQGYYHLFSLLKDVYIKDDYQVKKPYLPIYLLAGEFDPIAGGNIEFQETTNFFKNSGYLQVVNKLYPSMRHEILNEKNKKEVYNDILVFLDKKIEENNTELLS